MALSSSHSCSLDSFEELEMKLKDDIEKLRHDVNKIQKILNHLIKSNGIRVTTVAVQERSDDGEEDASSDGAGSTSTTVTLEAVGIPFTGRQIDRGAKAPKGRSTCTMCMRHVPTELLGTHETLYCDFERFAGEFRAQLDSVPVLQKKYNREYLDQKMEAMQKKLEKYEARLATMNFVQL